jgi:Fic family protein
MDDTLVKTVAISRNDRFYFSRNYDREKIGLLLKEAEVLYRTIKDIPVLPSIASQLDAEIMKRSIFGTAAIEGNPLTEDDVGSILSGKEVDKSKLNAEKEIKNLKIAYNTLENYGGKGKLTLAEENINETHSIIMDGLTNSDNEKGYRDKPVKVGDKEHGGTYRPPGSYKDIKLLMPEFITWFNSELIIKEDHKLCAAMAHYHLALIHPFSNGNGRTARILEATLLYLSGIKYVPRMLSNYYYQFVDDYYWAFSLSEKNKGKDITPFLEFFLHAMIDSLEKLKSRVLGYIRMLVAEDHYLALKKSKKINQRQLDLLQILLSNSESITAFDLFQYPQYSIIYRGKSERTAKRDLDILLKKNLLIKSEDGKYELNTKILDNL